MFGKPQSVMKIIEAKNAELEKLKEQMTKKMEADQEEFDEMLEGLLNTVSNFHIYKNAEKFAENAETA